MAEKYTRPIANAVFFAPSAKIALDEEFGWEDNVFSTPEARYWSADAGNDQQNSAGN